MRSIRLSLFLLLAVAVFCTANCMYVQKELKEVKAAAEHVVPGQPTEAPEVLRGQWERLFPYMTYVASYAELNRADEAVQELCAACETGSPENAASAKARLMDDLRRIMELEGVSLRAIF